jgi:hypothetical protein
MSKIYERLEVTCELELQLLQVIEIFYFEYFIFSRRSPYCDRINYARLEHFPGEILAIPA